MPPGRCGVKDDTGATQHNGLEEDWTQEGVLACIAIRQKKGCKMNYVTIGLDLVVKALNYFPGYKTKAGAAMQLLGTLLILYNTYLAAIAGFHVPADLVVAVNAAAATLVAVGAANQPNNVQKP